MENVIEQKLEVPAKSRAAKFIAYVRSLGHEPKIEVRPFGSTVEVVIEVASQVAWDRSSLTVQCFISPKCSYRRASERVRGFYIDICGGTKKGLTQWERAYHAKEIVARNKRNAA
ncbi:MAG TPA: hypothetical protein VEH04_16975 [Verrucomicrobiae bacterium]|nr:hypothetical protein [Verrucomicrobiae bacterium]